MSGDWTLESCCGGVDSVVSGLWCGGDGPLEGDPFGVSSIFFCRSLFGWFAKNLDLCVCSWPDGNLICWM